MIQIEIKDTELAKNPKVRKWVCDCEDILNTEFPEWKLDKMREEIALNMMLYGTFTPVNTI